MGHAHVSLKGYRRGTSGEKIPGVRLYLVCLKTVLLAWNEGGENRRKRVLKQVVEGQVMEMVYII